MCNHPRVHLFSSAGEFKISRHFSLSRNSVSGKSRFKHNDAHPIIGSNRRSVDRPYVRRRQRIPRDAGIVGLVTLDTSGNQRRLSAKRGRGREGIQLVEYQLGNARSGPSRTRSARLCAPLVN